MQDPQTYSQKWIDIHALSASVKKKEDHEHRLEAIMIIIESIRCEKCYKHATKYLSENNPRECFYEKDEYGVYVGLFNYFYKFHNIVNLRLNKNYFNYETAKEMYYGARESCEDFCGV